MKRVLVALVLLLAISPANPQKPSEFNRVSGKDVLDQLDAAIAGNEIRKKSPEETVRLVKRIILLNHMQIQNAEDQEYDAQHADQKKSSLAALSDLRKLFSDLRESICKDYDGILVDFDGQAKTGTCR